MKPCRINNKMSKPGPGVEPKPYAFVELGTTLYFGLPIDKYFTIDNFRNERCFAGDVDLIKLFWDTKIVPIVLT